MTTLPVSGVFAGRNTLSASSESAVAAPTSATRAALLRQCRFDHSPRHHVLAPSGAKASAARAVLAEARKMSAAWCRRNGRAWMDCRRVHASPASLQVEVKTPAHSASNRPHPAKVLAVARVVARAGGAVWLAHSTVFNRRSKPWPHASARIAPTAAPKALASRSEVDGVRVTVKNWAASMPTLSMTQATQALIRPGTLVYGPPVRCRARPHKHPSGTKMTILVNQSVTDRCWNTEARSACIGPMASDNRTMRKSIGSRLP